MTERNGFTLIELMVTLAVAAILATVAVPSFYNFIQNARTTAQANAFVTAINVARSEAVKRRNPVELCASTDPDNGACDTDDWTAGWVVRESGDSDAVIRIWEKLDASANLNEANDAAEIPFNNRGAAGDSYEFTLWFDDCTGEQTRTIGVNATGRAAVERDASECT